MSKLLANFPHRDFQVLNSITKLIDLIGQQVPFRKHAEGLIIQTDYI